MTLRDDDDTPTPRVAAGDARRGPPGACGVLVLIGGALEVGGAALDAFVQLATRTPDPLVVGITSASADPMESARLWRADLQAAGLSNVRFPIIERERAHDREVAAMIDEASAVFLGGGDQIKLVASLTGTATCDAIKHAYQRGAVICGTSAGAAALTELTMAGGEVDEEGKLVEQYLGPGLGLLGFRAVVDTHFLQRRRLQRLFLVVAENPSLFGIGIDENTALVVRGAVGRVVGAGTVTFVDGSASVRFDNANQLEVARQLTVSALRVGIVGSHYELNLEERELEVLLEAEEKVG